MLMILPSCLTRPFICLPGVVALSLWHIDKKFRSLSQKCLQSNLWLSRLYSSPAAALGIAQPFPPLEITLNHQALTFFGQALRFPADNYFLQRLASCPVRPKIRRRPSCSLQENRTPIARLKLLSICLTYTQLSCDTQAVSKQQYFFVISWKRELTLRAVSGS